MSPGIAAELHFFFLAVLRGMGILAIYDLLRIIRRVAVHGVWAVALEDFCYWIAVSLLVFQLLYRENDGAVRGYALLAVGAGMLLYHQIFGSWLVRSVSRILNCVLGMVWKPFRVVFGKIVQVLRMILRFYKKKLKKGLKEFIIILFS